MADNKITIVQGNETIQIVQPENKIAVTVNQESTVVTIVEKGPKGDKGADGIPGSAADITALNAFTGSVQTQVNSLIQATSSFITNSQTGSFVTTSTLSSYVLNSSTASFLTLSATASMLSSYVLNVNTSSFVTNSQTSSFVTNSVTSSMSVLRATTASYINTLNQNLIITGSTQGNVTALSIASNTASLDLSLGSFFTLQLIQGTNTYINTSNIKPGQSSMVLISTTGSATVSFPSSVKQPSGSSYVPTTTTGTDILTLASLDNTNLYIVSVKNLI